MSDLLNWNLFNNTLSESNNWLGYFGSLISSTLTVFLFFETIQKERENRYYEIKRESDERTIAARPTFLVKNDSELTIDIELFTRDGTPLRNVLISGRFKSGRQYQELLNIKSGEVKKFSNDIDYLLIESTSSRDEKNYYCYNSKEKREFSYSISEQKSLFYKQSGFTYFELNQILKELHNDSRIYSVNGTKERVVASEYQWILDLSDQDFVEIKEYTTLLEMQNPLDSSRLNWKSKILAYIKLTRSIDNLEDIIYGDESNYRLLIILRSLLKFLSTKPVNELNNPSEAFIGEFNSLLRDFCMENDCKITKATELLTFDTLLEYLKLLEKYLKYESMDQSRYSNKELVRLALYALSNHYELEEYQKPSYERFMINLLNELY